MLVVPCLTREKFLGSMDEEKESLPSSQHSLVLCVCVCERERDIQYTKITRHECKLWSIMVKQILSNLKTKMFPVLLYQSGCSFSVFSGLLVHLCGFNKVSRRGGYSPAWHGVLSCVCKSKQWNKAY